MASSVQRGFEPDWASEHRSYEATGPTGGFLIRTRSYPASSASRRAAYTSTDLAAYDEQGSLVGILSVAHGADQDGFFKIVVRPDALRRGWGRRLLAEVERQGIDLVAIAPRNHYTPSGRALLVAYLSGGTGEATR